MSVYERDFYAWTKEQAELLREHDFARLDLNNLIEEIESMGRSERGQLTSRLEVLLVHSLKWQTQPDLQSHGWRLTIFEQRRRIAKLLRANPSLHAELPDLVAEAYEDATYSAMRETGLAQSSFPATGPYPLERLLEAEWLPG